MLVVQTHLPNRVRIIDIAPTMEGSMLGRVGHVCCQLVLLIIFLYTMVKDVLKDSSSSDNDGDEDTTCSLNPPALSWAAFSLHPNSRSVDQKPGEMLKAVKRACTARAEISSSPQEKVWGMSLATGQLSRPILVTDK